MGILEHFEIFVYAAKMLSLKFQLLKVNFDFVLLMSVQCLFNVHFSQYNIQIHWRR